MAETINLVYIGSKPEKKDTVYGTNLSFPAGIPIPVPVDVVYKFLSHKDVWVKESDYELVQKEQEEKLFAAQLAAEKAEEDRLAELAAASLVVDGYGDLGKLTSTKLKTIVESESLGIEINPGELVRDYAVRVRDALKEKQAKAAE